MSGDLFGRSVALSGDYVLIGAEGADSAVGSAYVFERNSNAVWIETARLVALDRAGGDGFSRSVSLSGRHAVIGAFGDDDKGDFSGSTYIFERDDTTGTWEQETKLLASDGMSDDFFGTSVFILGDRIVIGALRGGDSGIQSGAAYIFERDPGTGSWKENVKLLPSDGAAGDLFGQSVSLSGNLIAIGAQQHGDLGRRSGVAYIFDVNEPPTTIAGPDQAIHAGDTVSLDGSGSFDDNTTSANLTNKVRLCEQSEPQSEPFVGQARWL